VPGTYSNKNFHPEHVAILRRGLTAWNEWRRQNPHLIPVLARIDLAEQDLRGINFAHVDLTRAVMRTADLSRANLYQADLYGADLRGCNLASVGMQGSKLHRTDLRQANLTGADMFRADFISAQVDDVNFTEARCLTTAFSDIDLTHATGLSSVIHEGPSNIDSATLLRSRGSEPEGFFFNAGVPLALIAEARRLGTSGPALQFNSVFISYSSEDTAVAEKIYDALRSRGVRVWFAPRNMRGGQLLFEQIDEAIQVHDRLLILLSEASIKSNWVKTELVRAWRRELAEGRRILFPVLLSPFEQLRLWSCFDADTGTDVAAAVRAYFIPDLSDWLHDEKFEAGVRQIINDLRATDGPGA
jgi:hypothetical protein